MQLSIKKMRKLAGLTQRQLASRLDVNLSTIGNWERGITVPDARQVWDCAVALRCTPNDILGWKQEDMTAEGRELLSSYSALDSRDREVVMTLTRKLTGDAERIASDEEVGDAG